MQRLNLESSALSLSNCSPNLPMWSIEGDKNYLLHCYFLLNVCQFDLNSSNDYQINTLILNTRSVTHSTTKMNISYKKLKGIFSYFSIETY